MRVDEILHRLHNEEGGAPSAPPATIPPVRNDDVAIRRLADAAGVSDADIVGPTADRRLQEVLDDWLTDISPQGLDRALEQLGDDADRLCDAHGVRMVLARGVNPFALLLATIVMEGACAIDFGDHMDHMQIGIDLAPAADDPKDVSWDGITIAVAPGMWWMGDNLRLPQNTLPDTVVQSLPGKPLAALIVQPELDGLDLTIDTVDTTSAPWITVRVKRETETLPWRDAITTN